MSKPDFAGCISADWHIDQLRNIEDTARCVDFVIAETIRRRDLLGRDVPFVFSHLGDAYKTFAPTPVEADILHRTRALKMAGIESEILVANHDRKESQEFGDQIHAFVDMRNLGGAMTVIEKPEIRSWSVGGRDIAYRVIIPHIAKAEVQSSGLTYPQLFKKKLDSMLATIPAGIPIIAMSHFFVREAKVGSSDHIMSGDQYVPVSDLVDPRLVAFFLGDVHCAQKLADKPWVGYCGSIDRVDFGEANDAKGFIYYEVRGTEIKIEFIPTPARRFLHIVADLVGNKTKGDKFFGVPESPSDMQPWLESKVSDYPEIKGTLVKVSIRCGPNQKALIDDRALSAVITRLGGTVRSVNFDVITAENRRSPEITESLSPVAALGRWVETQNYKDIAKQSILIAGKKIIGVEK